MKGKTHSAEAKLKCSERRTEYWNSLTLNQRLERANTIKGKKKWNVW